MAKFRPVPSFVRNPDGSPATPADVQAAEIQLAQLRKNVSYDLQQGFRRAALVSKLNSGMALSPIEYVEFLSVIPENYRVAEPNRAAFEESAKRRTEAAEARAAAKAKHQVVSPEEQLEFAKATMSPQDYMAFCRRFPHLVTAGLEKRG